MPRCGRDGQNLTMLSGPPSNPQLTGAKQNSGIANAQNRGHGDREDAGENYGGRLRVSNGDDEERQGHSHDHPLDHPAHAAPLPLVLIVSPLRYR
jgi:hypothetical protein